MTLIRGWILAIALLSPMAYSDTTTIVRDPFQPMAGGVADDDEIVLWRLEGVIGYPMQWSGWLSASGRGWLMVNVGDTVATTGWTVYAIDELGVHVEKRVMDATGYEQRWTRTLSASWSSSGTEVR